MAEPGTLYAALMSARVRLVSFGVGVGVFLGVPLALGLGFAIGFGTPIPLLFPVPFAAVLLLLWGLRITGYHIDDSSVTVLRPLRPTRIPLHQIDSVARNESPPEGHIVGLVRIDGFFGRQGSYRTREWGRFRMYVTDEARLVELRLDDGERVLLTPERPEAFVADLRGRLGTQQ